MPNNRYGWGAFLPRFNIPETFGAAISYEAQLHWFLENWDEVAEYANALEQPTIDVGRVNVLDSNTAEPDVRNIGTSINAILEFDLPKIYTRFADPLEWDFEKSYDVLTVVSDGSGNSYTSRQAVPARVALTNTDYWVRTGNYDASLERAYQLIDSVEREYSRVYQTATDMQADDELVPGMVCRTLGLRTVGKGGAWYLISETADGYSLVTAGGLYAVRVSLDLVYHRPEDYGAVGDGIADDTTALASAVAAACSDQYANCVLLTGQYRITGTIGITAPVLIFAWGSQEYSPAILVDFDGTALNVTTSSFCMTNVIMRATGAARFTATAVEINPQSVADIDCWLRFCKFFYFSECVIAHGRSVVVENCNFSNSGYGLHFMQKEGVSDSTRSYIVHQCRFHGYGRTGESEYTGSGILFDFSENYTQNEVSITGNYCDRSLGGVFISGSYVTGVISDNFIATSGGAFIELDGTNSGSDAAKRLDIYANHVSCRDAIAVDYAISLRECNYVTVRNNMFSNIAMAIVRVENSSYVNVLDNVINISGSKYPESIVREVAGTHGRYTIAGNHMPVMYSVSRVLKYVFFSEDPLVSDSSASNLYIYDNDVSCENVSTSTYYPFARYYDSTAKSLSPALAVGGSIYLGYATRTSMLYVHTSRGSAVAYGWGNTYRIFGPSDTNGNCIYGTATLADGTLTLDACDELGTDGSVVTGNLTINRIQLIKVA